MIRFCDKEVCCVMEHQLDRQQLMNYFMNGHRRDLVCVLDESGKFAGIITYISILGRDLEESINRNSMILYENAWEEGRECFERCPEQFGVEKMVPVLDKDKNLICFAYQDPEADQELRMIDELMKHKSVLGFADVYPQYDHVTVHGCNELAYYFVKYLKNLGISVSVSGTLWEEFDTLTNILRRGENVQNNETIDYRNLNIYAEGILQKREQLEIRQSVSPEFECVDHIYEKNILEGIIRDAEGNIENVLEMLKGKPIAVIGMDTYALHVVALNVYDFLVAHGLDICCFVSNVNVGQELFGKSVMTRTEAVKKWENIVFVQADRKNSAWGMGETNLYHYLGYKRNERFFLLQDYTELPANGLKHLLKYKLEHIHGRIVLTGDLWFCASMQRALKSFSGQNCKIVYCDILEKYQAENYLIQKISAAEIQKEDFCMLLIPKYYGCYLDKDKKTLYRNELERKYEETMKLHDAGYLTVYPFENVKWLREEEKLSNHYDEIKPKRIILGAINFFSGNYLFKEILEGHPKILQMKESILSSNLYSFCVRLSMQPADRILPLFWKLYEEIEICNIKNTCIFPDKHAFQCSMNNLLANKERFTSQELFVMIHIAYAEMMGLNVERVSDMTIYWEPHSVGRDEIEHYTEWLEGADEGYIVHIVRNVYISSGTGLRSLAVDRPMDRMLSVVAYPYDERKEYDNWKHITLKFESIKLNPKEELQRFCEKTGLLWSDKLLEVERSYKGLPGFDLAPVYRTWEEYFSSFDRFRICLIKGPWQKKYGYPYVRSLDFSRRELQQMFFKKFRFEENWNFEDRDLENAFLKWRQKLMCNALWEIRRKEVLGE